MTALFKIDDTVCHVRTGNTYLITMVPPHLRLESTNESAYAYEDREGVTWVRAQSQMEDGRFVLVQAAKETPDGQQ